MNAEEFNEYRGKHVKIKGEEYEVVGYNAETEQGSLLIINTLNRWGWKKKGRHDVIEKKSKRYWFVDKSEAY